MAGRVTQLVVERLPDSVKRGMAGPYNRVQAYRADRKFRRADRPEYVTTAEAPDHVVCVVVDALRADAVTPEIAPFIDARTRQAAMTTAPWTFPAVTSLFTGQYPHKHGAIRQNNESSVEATDLTVPPRLSAGAPTLSDVFAGAGYDTYGGFAFHMPFFALSGRFERHAVYDDAPAETVLDDYGDWVAERDRTFAYLHLADTHEPVDPPASYWRTHDVDPSIPNIRRWDYVGEATPGPDGERYRRHRERLYHAAIAYVDDQLARLHERLTERLDGGVALMITADHGEAFWDHAALDAATFADSRGTYCVDHGGTPYESVARVPLAVEGFDVADGGPVSLIDIAPTLLNVLGLSDALPTDGYSLRNEIPEDRILLIESARYGYEKKAAYLNGWKLIVSPADDAAVGFRLPEENRAELPAEVERRLREAMPPWPDGERADRAISGFARQRLEDLGYV